MNTNLFPCDLFHVLQKFSFKLFRAAFSFLFFFLFAAFLSILIPAYVCVLLKL